MVGIEDKLERWPGYDEQSWEQRFAELDRQYGELQNTTLGVVKQLAEHIVSDHQAFTKAE